MELFGTASRWLAVVLLLAALGIVVTLGIGRRRGTASYRLRVALWVALVSLGGGTVLASTLAAGEDPPRIKPTVTYTCYADWQIEGVLTTPDATPQRTVDPDVTSLPAASDPDVTFQPSATDPAVTSEPAPETGSTASQPAPTGSDAVSQPAPIVSPNPEPPYPVETCYSVM